MIILRGCFAHSKLLIPFTAEPDYPDVIAA
jgi:hypothetical protein